RIVRTDADVAARDAQGGKGHGVFRGNRVTQRDGPVAALGVGGPGIADRAEAGDAQRKLLRAVKSGKHRLAKDLADRDEGDRTGMGHRKYSATGGGGLSSTCYPSRPTG